MDMQRVIFVLLLLLAGMGKSLSAQRAVPPTDEAVLQPGDSVRIVVWDEPNLSGQFEVNPSGKIVHPLYQDLQVAGVPLTQFDTHLRTYLTRWRESPQFSFEPLFTVVVSGEVIKGGVFTLGPGVTLARAMTMAAPTRNARLDRVRLIRDRKTYVADFNDPEAEWIRVPVRSGDHIIVEPRLNVFRDVIGPVTAIMGSITSMISFVFFLAGT